MQINRLRYKETLTFPLWPFRYLISYEFKFFMEVKAVESNFVIQVAFWLLLTFKRLGI